MDRGDLIEDARARIDRIIAEAERAAVEILRRAAAEAETHLAASRPDAQAIGDLAASINALAAAISDRTRTGPAALEGVSSAPGRERRDAPEAREAGLLQATQMVIRGSSLEEIDRWLEPRFDPADKAAILDQLR